jgi:hypothetical protein
MTPARLTMVPPAATHEASAPADHHYGKYGPANSKGTTGGTGGNSTTPVIAAALPRLRRGERNEMRGRVRLAGDFYSR